MAMAMTAPSKGLWNHAQAHQPGNRGEENAVQGADQNLLADHSQAVGPGEVPCRQCPDRHRHRLGAGIAPHRGDDGHENGKGNDLPDRAFEDADDHGRHHGSPEIDEEPPEALARGVDHPLIEVGAGDTAKTEHILLRFLAQHVRHVVEGDGAQQPVVAIDDSHFGEPVLLEQPGNLFLVGIGLHGQWLALDERRQFHLTFAANQCCQRDDAERPVTGIDDKDRIELIREDRLLPSGGRWSGRRSRTSARPRHHGA